MPRTTGSSLTPFARRVRLRRPSRLPSVAVIFLLRSDRKKGDLTRSGVRAVVFVRKTAKFPGLYLHMQPSTRPLGMFTRQREFPYGSAEACLPGGTTLAV
jgi:hypothetical protein